MAKVEVDKSVNAKVNKENQIKTEKSVSAMHKNQLIQLFFILLLVHSLQIMLFSKLSIFILAALVPVVNYFKAVNPSYFVNTIGYIILCSVIFFTFGVALDSEPVINIQLCLVEKKTNKQKTLSLRERAAEVFLNRICFVFSL